MLAADNWVAPAQRELPGARPTPTKEGSTVAETIAPAAALAVPDDIQAQALDLLALCVEILDRSVAAGRLHDLVADAMVPWRGATSRRSHRTCSTRERCASTPGRRPAGTPSPATSSTPAATASAQIGGWATSTRPRRRRRRVLAEARRFLAGA